MQIKTNKTNDRLLLLVFYYCDVQNILYKIDEDNKKIIAVLDF